MVRLDAKDLVCELEKRSKTAKATPKIQLLNKEFKKQTAFIEDPSRFKAALCTARAGKSFGVGLYLFKTAIENPGCNCLYVAKTRDSAKKILWKDILKVINRKHGLGAKFNESELSVTLPNGSIVYLLGLDSSDEERDKVLGIKLKLAVVDEAASFRTDLEDLVFRVLETRVQDERGTICLISTPSNITNGLFYEVTTAGKPGWSVHKWSTRDNPYQAKQFEEQLAEIEKNRPLEKDTPRFKQMYLGQWAIDNSALVYKFNEDRNTYTALPKFQGGTWSYVLGVDLGSVDATALVVVAYHSNDRNLYVLSSYKEEGMDITDTANRIKQAQGRYPLDTIVIDGANKQAVQEISNRHGIPLRPADKRGKADFIEILNSESIQGKIKIHATDAASLIEEMQGLIVNERSIKWEENPTCPNHACDAFLYAWRFCYSYLSEPIADKPLPGTPEHAQALQDEQDARFDAQRARSRNQADYFPDSSNSFDSWDWNSP